MAQGREGRKERKSSLQRVEFVEAEVKRAQVRITGRGGKRG